MSNFSFDVLGMLVLCTKLAVSWDIHF